MLSDGSLSDRLLVGAFWTELAAILTAPGDLTWLAIGLGIVALVLFLGAIAANGRSAR